MDYWLDDKQYMQLENEDCLLSQTNKTRSNKSKCVRLDLDHFSIHSSPNKLKFPFLELTTSWALGFVDEVILSVII